MIVTACGNFAPFSLAGYSQVGCTCVPVIEAVYAGALLARSLGTLYRDLGVSTSKQSKKWFSDMFAVMEAFAAEKGVRFTTADHWGIAA